MRKKHHSKGVGRRARWALAAGSALLTGAAGLAAAEGTIYSWRTADGGYAFTDDEKAIPPRHRDEAEARAPGALEGYRRYTAKDDAASADYAERLAERLEHLRARNAASEALPQVSAGPERSRAPGPDITVRGERRDRGGVDLSYSTDAAEEPIVVETVWMRKDGGTVAQQVRVVRQGDRILSISKPRPREWSVSDVVDQSELLRQNEE